MFKVGLEIHVQLATKGKLFSPSIINYSSPTSPILEKKVIPNTLYDTFCSATPGTLPLLNDLVIPLSIRTCLLLRCKEIKEAPQFYRKHYPYPDLPHGYQITQSPSPIGIDGYFSPFTIRQIHLEQDTASLKSNLLNLNRANIPLLEIVTEPMEFRMDVVDLNTSFIKPLKNLLAMLRKCGITMGRLEDGNFRIDVNISSRGHPPIELKNLNSPSLIKKLILKEVFRQQSIVSSLFDDANANDASILERKTICSNGITRIKEDYFITPEYDLSPMIIDEKDILKEKIVLKNILDSPHLHQRWDHLIDGDGDGDFVADDEFLKDAYNFFSKHIEEKMEFKKFLRNDFKRYHNGKPFECFSLLFKEQFGSQTSCKLSFQDFRLKFKKISHGSPSSPSIDEDWINEVEKICKEMNCGDSTSNVGVVIAILRKRKIMFERSDENLRKIKELILKNNF